MSKIYCYCHWNRIYKHFNSKNLRQFGIYLTLTKSCPSYKSQNAKANHGI